MRAFIILLAGLATFAGTAAHAQPIPELRPFAGAYLPTGDQRDVLGDAMLIGAQAAYEVADYAHLVGTLAYTTPEAQHSTVGKDVHIYQYDLGVELFRSMPMASDWKFRPFVGAGLGARTHDFFDRSDTKARTYFDGYGTLGTEFQLARTAIRLEARDYMTRFKGLMGEEKAAWRNDVMLAAGIAFHLR